MDTDWDSKLVVGYKRQVAKVTKKDSDVNGARRAGAVVSVDKKVTGGANKARQAYCQA
ncbi:hypothetical protein AGABI1DRAFT_82571 [Agaricus bisporus var. burnettii JB137-S8]|uniref:Multiprotein bridging factor 1 N-terminal domain-containing protein n=1 Tax=Agaricus bisporus var. burnettii (strain JB137-S8 / ATCC MYA-4627 / FGSC 10392) TaxID=597362 RepID=K5XHA8_AGABU|nr:uncharacterized protein AGABI1DRAFT_82571 [Agaricus bisporus var. burnettii JB137-S8]EKM82843.1 hypothetical protein AGABI1DRAFT_82571 [Agaricus bisporus var. burnettii JB137-S8]